VEGAERHEGVYQRRSKKNSGEERRRLEKRKII